MNLKELRAKGALVPDAPVRKSVTWHDGKDEVKFDIHVKRLGFGEYERLFLVDEKDDRSRSARLLCEVVKLGDNGEESLPYKDAYRLEPSLARVLIDAINEVNGPKT